MVVKDVAPGGIALISVTAVFFLLATVIIALRFVARNAQRSLEIDDWAALMSYVFLIALAVCHCMIGGPYGYAGAPILSFSSKQYMDFAIMLYADNIVYTCTTTSVKIAVLLLQRRIFVTKIFKWITTGLGGLLVAWFLAVLFTQIFSCSPVEGSWNLAVKPTCIDTTKFYNAVTISNVCFDVILLILPMPMVWQLNMSMKKKVQVSGVFLVGAFTVLCSIMRTITLQQINTADVTGTIWRPGIWTFIESAVGVIVACMPPLAHLFKMWHRKVQTTFRSNNASHGTSQQQTYPQQSAMSATGTKNTNGWLELSEGRSSRDVELGQYSKH